ncbi:LacI family DNA-binding transcriptional regulator [uncultured Ruegeria sp.]|uniref:LacI family DNA-binding transcriptional regulator n=1 Tax=uncultured Ruegeria sp. TaxID=259304 RepID=UPI0026272303|nr:LacI family DNA-binding transcriptional regulator [uncultured Ruegeria sp.]
MGRATIKGIAAAAGVSTATVDRALNGRPGVSSANRQRVLVAARDLGYLPSEGMVLLPSKPAELEFLVPFDHNAFMSDIIAYLTEFAASLPLVKSCKVTPLSGIGPKALTAALENLSLYTQGVGIIATDHVENRRSITALCDAGVRVVTLASDIPDTPRSAYVGMDNHVAGKTAARLMGMSHRARRGKIAVFLGSHDYHGHREREAGFREVMSRKYPNLKLLSAIEAGEDNYRLQDITERLLECHPNLQGIYCIGAGRKGIVAATNGVASEKRPFIVMHDLTKNSAAWLAENRIDAVVDQNARLVAEQAIIRLLGSIATGTPLLPTIHVEPRIILAENLPTPRDAMSQRGR